MEIKWKQGARVSVEADVAHTELERIRKKYGGEFTTADVVKEEKARKAPLHDEFIWDNDKAAHEQRCSRAGDLMRSLVVVFEEDTEGKHPTRRYSAERREGASHAYCATEDILADPERRTALVQEALKKLLQWRVQYRHLNELAIVFRSHDEVLQQIGETA